MDLITGRHKTQHLHWDQIPFHSLHQSGYELPFPLCPRRCCASCAYPITITSDSHFSCLNFRAGVFGILSDPGPNPGRLPEELLWFFDFALGEEKYARNARPIALRRVCSSWTEPSVDELQRERSSRESSPALTSRGVNV